MLNSEALKHIVPVKIDAKIQSNGNMVTEMF